MTDCKRPALESGVSHAVAELFDRLPDVVFFVKDSAGRYVAVNETLVRRLGVRSRAELVGRTAAKVFPPPLGERYLRQDRSVCRTGRAIEDLLELHLYPEGREGWCLTTKLPLRVAGPFAGEMAFGAFGSSAPPLLAGAVALAALAGALVWHRRQ